MFFEENPVQKWDLQTPIPYTFDDSLGKTTLPSPTSYCLDSSAVQLLDFFKEFFFSEELDKEDVRNALREIEEKTCVRFEYVASPSGYHINYLRVDSPTL